MKKMFVALMAVSLFASVPAFAMEHGPSHDQSAEQCEKECEMLLRNCAQEVDSIQQRIGKIQTEIKEKGATTYTLEELKTLEKKLKEANETLKVLQRPR
ncbi:hypothetical protein [Geobacter pickeringii]|uniref:Uncharacterized protein n=1 Tax=Geobacter pickeringii TaxID=345632 RepID=A0A0B5BG70_9BACT|nr:hypothetical protein [Geobacter pickeringii]AJE03515.1 hypothetical protein GPICK_09280 [Geobacter pickeringii]